MYRPRTGQEDIEGNLRISRPPLLNIRVPTAQGKWQNKSLSGKTQGILKLCQNTGKRQGIWFAQVVNSLILKVKDISIFAVKISPKKLKLDKSAKSVLCI